MGAAPVAEDSELLEFAVGSFARTLSFQEWEEKAREHPAYLVHWMVGTDEKTGEEFRFNMFDEGEAWFWQRGALEELHQNQMTIWLKARQLGLTWLCGAYGLWITLTKPGTRGLVYRQKEEDAIKGLHRIWEMYHSLPEELRFGTKVIVPQMSERPSTEFTLKFPNGKKSTILAMSSAASAGHGETAAWVLLDELGRIDDAESTASAVFPVVGKIGKVMAVSTANGVSNEETGEGNYFHWLWTNARESGFRRIFLSWRMHPDRDDEWYMTNPEVRALKPWQRAEQYPDTWAEAFAMSSAVYFDPEALEHYQYHLSEPLYFAEFVPTDERHAKLVRKRNGLFAVYREPNRTHAYAIGADVATGRGLDYSVAYVIDLATREICAEFRAKVPVEDFAFQLHYLGTWFSQEVGEGDAKETRKALIAPEMAGGYGDALIVALRDATRGRPAYPKLYKHRQFVRADQNQHASYGFPMGQHSRPQVLSYLDEMIRERATPHLPANLFMEMGTFIRFNPKKPSEGGTWPRAMAGCHDDCVMAAAVTFEMYRQYGFHPAKTRRDRNGNPRHQSKRRRERQAA